MSRFATGTVAVAIVFSALCGCARTRCFSPCEARANEPAQVLLEAMVLRAPQERVTEIVGSDALPGAPPRVLSAADAAAIGGRAAKTPGVTVVAMPAILALAGQEATVSVGETLAGSSGAPPSTGYDDVASPSWAGQRFRTIPTPSPDGSTVGLDFSFALRDRPVEGTSPDAAAILASTVRGDVRVESMPSGGSFLLVAAAGPSAPDDRVLVLVSATVLRPDAAAR